MNDRTVTLSDGSVWAFTRDPVGLPEWKATDGVIKLSAPYLKHDEPFTAADHRAIANVLEPESPSVSRVTREQVAKAIVRPAHDSVDWNLALTAADRVLKLFDSLPPGPEEADGEDGRLLDWLEKQVDRQPADAYLRLEFDAKLSLRAAIRAAMSPSPEKP